MLLGGRPSLRRSSCRSVKMASKWRKVKLPVQTKAEAQPVPIAWDGAAAVRGVAGGRMIPLLILDTSGRPDIEEMIRLHKHLAPGDAETRWMLRSRWSQDTIGLVFKITRPVLCTFIVEFDLNKYAGFVDQLMMAEVIYIQPGRMGDRVATTIDNERILVEVPCREIRNEWD